MQFSLSPWNVESVVIDIIDVEKLFQVISHLLCFIITIHRLETSKNYNINLSWVEIVSGNCIASSDDQIVQSYDLFGERT